MMDANGIGTDATMADHIATIVDRQYVTTRAARHGNHKEQSKELSAQARTANSRRRGGRTSSGAGSSRSSTGVREFIPTTLGVALTEGFASMGFETDLMKPFLRKEVRALTVLGHSPSRVAC